MRISALLFAVACLSPLWAQPGNQSDLPRYSSTTGDVSLSGAATAFTIQQPPTNAKTLYLESAVAYCSVACTLTQSSDGTAATSTAGTIVPLPPITVPASATTWTASNVGTGTAAGGAVHLPAGGNTAVLDLSRIVLPAGNTNTNYTVSIASLTGTVNITFFWKEARQ